jgi:formate dehydrogenase
VTTTRAAVQVPVEITDRMQSGHVFLPNGLGVDYSGVDREATPLGVAPNDLTAGEDRDWLAGTPWHKTVLDRVEAI